MNWTTDVKSQSQCRLKHHFRIGTKWKQRWSNGSCRRCYLEASAWDWSQVWWKEEEGRLEGRKAEACLWDQERQEAGENPHQPWAAAWEEPENIYRILLEISHEKVTCYTLVTLQKAILSDQVTHHHKIDITTSTRLECDFKMLELLFTWARGGAAEATGITWVSSGCCGSERPLWVSSSGRSRLFLTPLHSVKHRHNSDSRNTETHNINNTVQCVGVRTWW